MGLLTGKVLVVPLVGRWRRFLYSLFGNAGENAVRQVI